MIWKQRRGDGTFLCELLSFAEQAVEDGTEVGEQPLAVLQQLQRLRVGEVGRAVEQRRTCTTDTAQIECRHAFNSLLLHKEDILGYEVMN